LCQARLKNQDRPYRRLYQQPGHRRRPGLVAGGARLCFSPFATRRGGRGFSYAAAVADDAGNIRTAFTFPNEARWVGQAWADVIGRGTRSSMEAITPVYIDGTHPHQHAASAYCQADRYAHAGAAHRHSHADRHSNVDPHSHRSCDHRLAG